MSASLEMQFQMTKGSDEEFQAVLGVLEDIGRKPLEQLRDLSISKNSFLIVNMFPNIWGEEYLELDVEPYYLFAKAAPNAEWVASSDRLDEGDGSNSWDKASYSNGVTLKTMAQSLVFPLQKKPIIWLQMTQIVTQRNIKRQRNITYP